MRILENTLLVDLYDNIMLEVFIICTLQVILKKYRTSTHKPLK